MARQRRSVYGKVDARLIAGIVILVVLAAGGILLLRSKKPAPEPPPTTNVPPGRSPFPELKEKPAPKEIIYKGCPPEGDGGDPELNRLKNRVDEAASYYPIPFDDFVGLQWPKAVERRDRDRWSSADKEAVARYEGIPVAVEGYLASSKSEKGESCNCHGIEDDQVDFHIFLTREPTKDRSNSIVVETTPRVRYKHPNWTTKALGQIARNDLRVRVSGWMMLDPEHPDQVGKTRGTIWEIHPIMKIEVQQNGNWILLDDYNDK